MMRKRVFGLPGAKNRVIFTSRVPPLLDTLHIKNNPLSFCLALALRFRFPHGGLGSGNAVVAGEFCRSPFSSSAVDVVSAILPAVIWVSFFVLILNSAGSSDTTVG